MDKQSINELKCPNCGQMYKEFKYIEESMQTFYIPVIMTLNKCDKCGIVSTQKGN